MSVIPWQVVQKSNIVTRATEYPWDEWNVRDYYTDIDPDLFDRLDVLSNCATIGLAIACGEWVSYRFRLLDSDRRPIKFLEAACAGVVHTAYCHYTETDDEQWRGPVRGPLNMTITIVNDALFCLDEDPNAPSRACWMYNLTKHVINNPVPFDAWFETIVKRLESFCPRPNEEDEDLFVEVEWMGAPVPRNLYDPNFTYDLSDRVFLLDEYLRGLDPTVNPYLKTPAELSHIEALYGRIYRFF